METQKRPYQIMNSTTTNYLACGLEHFLFVHILGIVTPTDFHHTSILLKFKYPIRAPKMNGSKHKNYGVQLQGWYLRFFLARI